MQVVMATQNGEEHGMLRKLPNSVKEEQAYKNLSAEKKSEIEKKRKRDNAIVRAQYLHRKEENGILEKPYCRYAGDPIQIWKFINGYEYDVPQGLIDEVNESSQPNRSKVEMDGKPVKDGAPQRIHQFIPIKWS